MADPHGFLTVEHRELPKRRPVPIRLMDFKEVYEAGDPEQLRRQASRCMDCGIPFCHQGCPLGNLIPEFNDAMYRGELPRAVELLHATNNFPEFTGRACPAPCENACVLGINQPAVTIKQVEVTIVDQGFEAGLIQPIIPERITGHTVAVIGSGPTGLAAAQQLTRAGHTVVVYERADRLGGLLRYGIPDFKLEKHHIDRRLDQMRAEGTRFKTSVEVGRDVTLESLRSSFDAVIVCTGATVPRDMPIPGRDLDGVEFAMDYLVPSNRDQAGDHRGPEADSSAFIDAAGKHVIIIGGGDTGADCLGTALRQKAASVTTLAIGAQPPAERSESDPWPTVPRVFEVQSSHEEGGTRKYLASTTRFVGDDTGRVSGIEVAETQFVDGRRIPTPGTEHVLEADLVLLALGFSGPESESFDLDVAKTGAFTRDDSYASETPGVFVAGDAGRGQSLIVWGIAEGRAAAAEVDRFLTGSTRLPAPVQPTDEGFKC
ncbi:MAG: glutamate synthase subunit beta [Brevibacterium sp.]|uniref:Glutamate synthase (NADH) small subunit n=1 Tax=Brevibacterium linens ATCC 9172 TaxID=1255617 RepID=A0A2H1HKR1_BRELN|nr:glutamate synthase subunit beta [Brevibacterium linens]AZU00895.1 glutamate synthase subunit beta [Brevibacterium linens]KAB1949595.1 glutamate synthase subunit beta [Brevibacterium linens ATCC 9172]SMX63523.1 glutamate synthase (NADH) small subunit [Brevibacterium linens ATCC 9172]